MPDAGVRVTSYRVARTVWRVECDYCDALGADYPCASEGEARQLLAQHVQQSEHVEAAQRLS